MGGSWTIRLEGRGSWFKHILLINTKGLGVAKLRRKGKLIRKG